MNWKFWTWNKKEQTPVVTENREPTDAEKVEMLYRGYLALKTECQDYTLKMTVLLASVIMKCGNSVESDKSIEKYIEDNWERVSIHTETLENGNKVYKVVVENAD